MAGLFLSFLVDYFGQRAITHSRDESRGLSPQHTTAVQEQRREVVTLYVLEAGIIFHSISM
jgi:hypothetical protein